MDILKTREGEEKVGVNKIYQSSSYPYKWLVEGMFNGVIYGEYKRRSNAVKKANNLCGIKTLAYFWDHAKCTNSIKKKDPGCKKYRQHYDKDGHLVRVRRYVDPRTGEKRVTVEIEVEI